MPKKEQQVEIKQEVEPLKIDKEDSKEIKQEIIELSKIDEEDSKEIKQEVEPLKIDEGDHKEIKVVVVEQTNIDDKLPLATPIEPMSTDIDLNDSALQALEALAKQARAIEAYLKKAGKEQTTLQRGWIDPQLKYPQAAAEIFEAMVEKRMIELKLIANQNNDQLFRKFSEAVEKVKEKKAAAAKVFNQENHYTSNNNITSIRDIHRTISREKKQSTEGPASFTAKAFNTETKKAKRVELLKNAVRAYEETARDFRNKAAEYPNTDLSDVSRNWKKGYTTLEKTATDMGHLFEAAVQYFEQYEQDEE